jgi:GTP cyclohydrolase I
MKLLRDIIALLDEIAPFSTAEEWDNPGLQVGSLSSEIKKILISLDPTVNSLRKAKDINAQLLLTHHPLIFSKLSNINQDTYPGDVITEALTSGTSIVTAHTNLDVAKNGINNILAEIFGLLNVKPLIRNSRSEDALNGMGRIGELPNATPFSDISIKIINAIGLQGAMVLGDQDKMIKKIAVLGGAGGDEVLRAHEQGADLYVTGDVRHHEALTAQRLGLALIDGGHFHTEKTAMNVFANRLKDKITERGWDIVLENYEDEKAPMLYLSKD